ncbi:MAG TPA: tyrosine-type recombinase/integrase [Coriobacteriia bacterium]
MAHIITRKLADGKKRYLGKVFNPSTGRDVYTHTWPTKKDALREAEEIRRRIILGEDPKPRIVTFREYVNTDFLCSINHLADSTQEDYRLTCRRLMDFFGDMPLKNITTRDCERHLAELVAGGHSPYTVRKSLTRLRQILRRAVRDGLISRSPADDVAYKHHGELRQKEIVVLDKEQILKFIDLAPTESKSMFTVWFATGLRFGELAGLTWQAVDWRNSQILVRTQIQDGRLLPHLKSKTSRRQVPVSAGVLDVLRAHREVCPPSEFELVFPTMHGHPQHRSNIHRLFTPIVEEMGLTRFTPHCIRHTFATVLLSEGLNPKAVAVLLGHSPGSGDLIMSTYGHLLPSDVDRAAQTMGDILIREDGPADKGVVVDLDGWRQGRESDTMYERQTRLFQVVCQA